MGFVNLCDLEDNVPHLPVDMKGLSCYNITMIEISGGVCHHVLKKP